MKAVLTIAQRSLGDASSLSDKTYQWAWPTVPKRHRNMRLDRHRWANPDLTLSAEGSCGVEVSFTALGICR